MCTSSKCFITYIQVFSFIRDTKKNREPRFTILNSYAHFVHSFFTPLFVFIEKNNQFESTSAILNKHDVCCFSSRPIHHTFSLLLDCGTRVYAHVLRYLPIHSAVQTRYDIGRRGERAMVLMTRATGGVRFYASLLKYVYVFVFSSPLAI